jgi:hypothetical protein
MRQRLVLCSWLLFAATLSWPGSEVRAGSSWTWRLTPLYLWLPNIGGNLSGGDGGPPVDIADFNFRFEKAFSANFEGSLNNRWGFVTDLISVDLSNTNDTRDSRLDLGYLQLQLDGYYRLPLGGQFVDLLAGLRYQILDISLDPRPVSLDKDLLDPVIGARWLWPLTDRWTFTLRGDFGGFGIGSELSWKVVAVADFRPWEHVSITAGVRGVGLDVRAGAGLDRVDTDLDLWGPLVGLSFRW